MNWRKELNESINNVDELYSLGYVDKAEAEELRQISKEFPIAVPRYYLALIDKSDPNDPIRRMCIPTVLETDLEGSFDTSGELDNTVLPGLQHKYRNTALVLSTNVCAMYCRHCFRKRLVGVSDDETVKMLDAITDYIQAHEEIDNVLVSGGDAMLNSNYVILRTLENLCGIKHLRFIRLGTRVPVVLPARITGDNELLNILESFADKKLIYIVTQFNHARELTAEAKGAIKALRKRGMVVSNQTVLLRGVNDTPQELARLLNALTEMGVLPYYLFQCRPVSGVKRQFQIPLLEASRIVDSAMSLLNGHAKRCKFVLSHETGKIEIVGRLDGETMLFKYHQPKYDKDTGRIMIRRIDKQQCWLDIDAADASPRG